MNGEKRPRLLKREAQDMARMRKVQSARRIDVLSRLVREVVKSVRSFTTVFSAGSLFAADESALGFGVKKCSMAARAEVRFAPEESKLERLMEATMAILQRSCCYYYVVL